MGDDEAARALRERLNLFTEPGLLEKYVATSEFALELFDMFVTRIFGAQRPPGDHTTDMLRTLFEDFSLFSTGDGFRSHEFGGACS